MKASEILVERKHSVRLSLYMPHLVSSAAINKLSPTVTSTPRTRSQSPFSLAKTYSQRRVTSDTLAVFTAVPFSSPRSILIACPLDEISSSSMTGLGQVPILAAQIERC